jgi:hypothetical protein
MARFVLSVGAEIFAGGDGAAQLEAWDGETPHGRARLLEAGVPAEFIAKAKAGDWIATFPSLEPDETRRYFVVRLGESFSPREWA